MKTFIVHPSRSLQTSSIHSMFSVEAINKFDVWLSDVTQGYLQSRDGLKWPVIIKRVAPKLDLDCYLALNLMSLIYVLSESRDLFFETLDKHQRKYLSIKTFRTDPTLSFLTQDKRLIGMSGTSMDDILRIGSQQFRKMRKPLTHCS